MFLDFGLLPFGKRCTRKVQLTNLAPFSIAVSWQLPELLPMSAGPAESASSYMQPPTMSVLPMEALLAPHNQLEATVFFSNGWYPEFLELEARCTVTEVLGDNQEENEAKLLSRMAADAAARVKYTEAGEMIEEVIAEHPPADLGKVAMPREHQPLHRATTLSWQSRMGLPPQMSLIGQPAHEITTLPPPGPQSQVLVMRISAETGGSEPQAGAEPPATSSADEVEINPESTRPLEECQLPSMSREELTDRLEDELADMVAKIGLRK
ncbi:hypothetical protein WJX84_009185 [Apatococcus fuscideae]